MKKIIAMALCFVAGTAMAARAPGESTAWKVPDCDHACLSKVVTDYMAALAKRNPGALKVNKDVRFTENNVELPFGKEGFWATVTAVAPNGLVAADVQSGTAAWLGTAEENGKPVYFAMRLGVRDGALAEVETIVVRNTGLPLPFADVAKVVHDSTFNEILPAEQRRSRERLRAVADGYFNTVELNDGNIFTPFDIECGRLENGILTTAGNAAGTGGISPGCEAGLKTGMYRINKRIRERRYPVIDVERGVVVATGFFDHANEFDRYKLVDGKEQRTALKWPNSISLIEAFRVKDSKIHRIEAVFTYVPHRMHNPFYEYLPVAPPPAEDAGTLKEKCDKACLLSVGDRFMTAFAAQKPADVPWARYVQFTENGVGIPVGEGIWGSIRSKSETALRVADAVAGTYAWYGLIYDHDAPAYAGVRLKLTGAKISEAEVVVARERNPGPWGDLKKFAVDARFEAVVPAALRSTRKDLIAAAQGYAETVQRNDGTLKTKFDPNCNRTENGVVVSQGDVGSIGLVKSPGQLAQGCEGQLKLGLYRPVDRVRGRRVLAVDEERGLVIMDSIADFGLAQRQYTLTNGQKVESDRFHPMARELYEV
ncbi:MAG: hypothetical protein ABI645_13095, partial [Pseudomonadota bacterium]